jgi:hypothetical protein
LTGKFLADDGLNLLSYVHISDSFVHTYTSVHTLLLRYSHCSHGALQSRCPNSLIPRLSRIITDPNKPLDTRTSDYGRIHRIQATGCSEPALACQRSVST